MVRRLLKLVSSASTFETQALTEVTHADRYAQRANDRFVGDMVSCSLSWNERVEQSKGAVAAYHSERDRDEDSCTSQSEASHVCRSD